MAGGASHGPPAIPQGVVETMLHQYDEVRRLELR